MLYKVQLPDLAVSCTLISLNQCPDLVTGRNILPGKKHKSISFLLSFLKST